MKLRFVSVTCVNLSYPPIFLVDSISMQFLLLFSLYFFFVNRSPGLRQEPGAREPPQGRLLQERNTRLPGTVQFA